jgi:hypothetical protein
MEILEYHQGILMTLSNWTANPPSTPEEEQIGRRTYETALETLSASLVDWGSVFAAGRNFSAHIAWRQVHAQAARLFYGYFRADPERKIYCVFPGVLMMWSSPLDAQLLRHVVPWRDMKHYGNINLIPGLPSFLATASADLVRYLSGLDDFISNLYLGKIHYWKTTGNHVLQSFTSPGSSTMSDAVVCEALNASHPFCTSTRRVDLSRSRLTSVGVCHLLENLQNLMSLNVLYVEERVDLGDGDSAGLLAALETKNTKQLRDLRMSARSVGMRFVNCLSMQT